MTVACHVAGRYVRLIPPTEPPRFSERNGYVPVVPLAFGWRVVVRPAYETPIVEDELLTQERDAWIEYLEATRGQTAVRYAEVEPWAWTRLSQRLRAIRARRKRRAGVAPS